MFTRLVHRADVGFSFRFLSALPHSVHGTAQLRLTLGSSLGWTVPLPSPDAQVFSGDSVRLSHALDLAAIETQLSRYLARTGVANDSFSLTMTPRVSVRGSVAGQAVVSTFEPTSLTFVVDPYTLRLAQSAASAGPGEPAADPLHPSAAGTVARIAPRTIGILGHPLAVVTARRVALYGLLAAAVSAALALAGMLAMRRRDETTQIHAHYRELLISVSTPPTTADGDVLDVESFDDLARIATYRERPVLSVRDADSDHFYIAADGVTYRYTPGRTA